MYVCAYICMCVCVCAGVCVCMYCLLARRCTARQRQHVTEHNGRTVLQSGCCAAAVMQSLAPSGSAVVLRCDMHAAVRCDMPYSVAAGSGERGRPVCLRTYTVPILCAHAVERFSVLEGIPAPLSTIADPSGPCVRASACVSQARGI